MSSESDPQVDRRGLRSHEWLLSYRTSSTLVGGRPVDILHDFYIPALSCSVGYDRVAGYFRSSSLAAASEGFSVFVNHGGRMRLVVGADLTPEDVRAILAGDAARLESRLDSELCGIESWPESVRNGVTLLAWMVSQGHLEVRVALRVHGETGSPIPYDSVEDGYVHEKWFVFTDQDGNRLYGSGTLNESRTALTLNAENVDVHCDWWDDRDRSRVDEAAQAFEQVWADRSPNIRVLTLPEAVRKHLISIAEGVDFPLEIDGTSAVPKPVPAPDPLEILRFAVLKDAPKMPGGKYVGMETAPVEPWPHQRIIARRLIETWPYSYLLCDEVGLGKTIEAGLAFRSLYLSGLAKRILVAAPPTLGQQWHREMASKMLMPFGLARSAPYVSHSYIFPAEKTDRADSPFDPDLAIVSTGLLARKNWAERLAQSPPFEVVLVDEAHNLRRSNPVEGAAAHPKYGYLYSNARDYLRPRARSFWLATATPMQLHAVEICDLLALTDRVGSFQHDESLVLQFYECFRRLVAGEQITAEEWRFLSSGLKDCMHHDPLFWEFLKATLMDNRASRVVSEWLDHERIPRGHQDTSVAKRALFATAPASRVRMRHTRALLEIYRSKGQLKENLPRREICPMPGISFTSEEREVYEAFDPYCTELGRRLLQSGTNSQSVRFLLSFFRLRFASSFYAIRQTLRRRLAKVEAGLESRLDEDTEMIDTSVESLGDHVFGGQDEDDDIPVSIRSMKPEDLEWEARQAKEILARVEALPERSSKMQALYSELDGRYHPETGRFAQTVVFTRFYDTLTDIVARLEETKPGILVGTYSGKGAEYFSQVTGRMVSATREEVKRLFMQGEIDILVCTDAAAEGLNLQTADEVINFDLGWNPMKIEQRVGRIDRIGQVHDVIRVLNLCYTDSEEQVVYGRLLRRLEEAGLIVGAQPYTLLPIRPEEFADLAFHKTTPEALEKKARERMEDLRQRSASMEVPPNQLYDMYVKLLEKQDQPLPCDLNGVWRTITSSRHLAALGCIKMPDSEDVFSISGVPGVSADAALTVSRRLYETGVKKNDANLHFTSYGDPVFQAVLDLLSQFDLPSCARRVSVQIPGFPWAEMVAIAVLAKDKEGNSGVRLIKGLNDLNGLELDLEATISESQVRAAEQDLEKAAELEFGNNRAVEMIERKNVEEAVSHQALVLYAARAILEEVAGAELGAAFWPLYSDLEQRADADLKAHPVRMPSNVVSRLAADSLFEIQVVHMGPTAFVTLPKEMLKAAIDALARSADSLKLRRSAVTVGGVFERLRHDIEEIEASPVRVGLTAR